MMFRKSLVGLLIISMLIPILHTAPAAAKDNEKNKYNKNYVEGEIIVKLKDGKEPKLIDGDAESWQKAVKGKWQAGKQVFRKKVKEGKEGEQIEKLSQNPYVEYAEPNYIFETEMEPNDPYYSSAASWGQGFDDLWGLKNINAPAAWDASQGEGITVAVIDTGIDYTHPDLAANIWQNSGETGLDANGANKSSNDIDDDDNGYIDDWHGWDASTITTATTGWSSYITGSKEMDNDPMDDAGHGTHVAGTIAAVGNNNLGVIGVAPKAKIMPVKFLTANGGITSDGVTALLYAAENGAKVLNNSWGGGGYSQLFKDALSYIHDDLNVVVIASAGNDAAANWNHLPSAYPEAISVAASMFDGGVTDYSSYGKVDITAPGNDILSTRSSQSTIDYDIVGNDYQVLSGTSMASPHVSGAAALLLAQNPSLQPEDVRQILAKSADDLATPGYDIRSGAGKVNAIAALNSFVVGNALITSPIGNQSPGQLAVYGQLSSQNFNHFSLSYGAGIEPASWQEIANSSILPDDGFLGTFDTSNLALGEYTLKLAVFDSRGNVCENQRYLNLGEELVISEVNAELVSSTEAIIRWKTNRQGEESYFEYGTTNDYGSLIESEGYYPDEYARLIDLEPATTYHFRVIENEFAHLTYSADQTFTTPEFVVEISNISAVAEPHKFTLNWQTNVPTTSEIQYDNNHFWDNVNLKYSQKVFDDNLTTEHTVVVPGTDLSPFDPDYLYDNSTYRYLIRAKDAAGNAVTSGQQLVKTLPGEYAVISGVTVSNLSDTAITLSWQTNLPSKSVVDYWMHSPNPALQSFPSGRISDEEYKTEHQVTVDSAWPSSNLSFDLYAISPDNSMTGIWDTVSFPATIYLSNLSLTPELGSMVVSWQTDLPANELVAFYCPGPAYQYYDSGFNNVSKVDHSIRLYNLPSNNSCVLTVRGIDSAGRKLMSETIKFDTSVIIPDTEAPSGSIVIDDGEAYTNSNYVDLKLAASDNAEVISMMIKSDEDADWSVAPYGQVWVSHIQNSGTRQIFVKYIDRAGNESPVYSDDIILDQQAPVVYPPTSVENPTSNRQPVFTWPAAADLLSGVNKYEFDLQASNGTYWTYNETVIGTAFTPSLVLNTGTYFATLRAIDNAGNVGIHTQAYTIQISDNDIQAPTGSVQISNNASLTNTNSVSLSLPATDNVGVAKMQLSYDNIVWLPWETYSATKAWSLSSGNGIRTVYVRYRDAAGNTSQVYSDSIMLDTSAPTGTVIINGGAAYTNSQNVTLSLSAADANGIAEIQLSNDGVNFTFMLYSSNIGWGLSQDGGNKIVCLRVKDNAGNVSTIFSDAITLDMVGPVGSLKINNNATDTKSQNVTLNISASDSLSGLSQMRFSNDGISWSAWQAYAATKTWSLAPGKGTKTVYAQYSDKAGNISIAYYDSIIRK